MHGLFKKINFLLAQLERGQSLSDHWSVRPNGVVLGRPVLASGRGRLRKNWEGDWGRIEREIEEELRGRLRKNWEGEDDSIGTDGASAELVPCVTTGRRVGQREDERWEPWGAGVAPTRPTRTSAASSVLSPRVRFATRAFCTPSTPRTPTLRSRTVHCSCTQPPSLP
jgi:hypothetical protein